MKRVVVASIAVATLLLVAASDASASCFRRGGCGGCAPAYSSCDSCGSGPMAGPVSPATCTVYKAVWTEKEELVNVYKTVTKEVEFKYIACVPVMRAEKRKVCTLTPVTKGD